MIKRRIWAKISLHYRQRWPATFVLALAFVGFATGDKCDKICGKAEETENARELIIENMERGMDKDKTTTTTTPKPGKMTSRIVNGYAPPERPFMVLIAAYEDYESEDPEEKNQFGKCGGSIINNKFILTAAHCVCQIGSEYIPCTKEDKLEYDPKEVLKVVAGATVEMDMMDHDMRRKLERDVDEVFVHPLWKGGTSMEVEKPEDMGKNGHEAADIAMIKLAKALVWGSTVSPICLPEVADLKVKDDTAYVAGWGQTEGDRKNCVVDNRGPARNLKCRFPFKLAFANDVEIQECYKGKFPSDENPKCKQFHQFHKNKFDFGNSSYVKIWYNHKEAQTYCYSPEGAKDKGWCGVCLNQAKPGEEGYCPDNMENNEANDNRNDEEYIEDEELDKEVTVVKPGKNWGYCSPECDNDYNGESKNTLKETMQQLFRKDVCDKIYEAQGEVRSDGVMQTEICGGLKFDFPTYAEYNRQFVGKKENGENKYKFIKMKDSVDTLDMHENMVKLGFYIGYSDSCLGDSGGPFYQFKDGKVIQVGLVSRGGNKKGGCALSNAPGIYTDVFPFMKWILETSKTGKC